MVPNIKLNKLLILGGILIEIKGSGRDNRDRALEVLRLPVRGSQGWEIIGMSSEGMGGEDRASK